LRETVCIVAVVGLGVVVVGLVEAALRAGVTMRAAAPGPATKRRASGETKSRANGERGRLLSFANRAVAHVVRERKRLPRGGRLKTGSVIFCPSFE